MRGTLFDQSNVVAGAKEALVERGVIDRCGIVGGGFFEMVPEAADAYLMRVVIHDWEDEDSHHDPTAAVNHRNLRRPPVAQSSPLDAAGAVLHDSAAPAVPDVRTGHDRSSTEV
jgi:hypothetical protein